MVIPFHDNNTKSLVWLAICFQRGFLGKHNELTILFKERRNVMSSKLEEAFMEAYKEED